MECLEVRKSTESIKFTYEKTKNCDHVCDPSGRITIKCLFFKRSSTSPAHLQLLDVSLFFAWYPGDVGYQSSTVSCFHWADSGWTCGERDRFAIGYLQNPTVLGHAKMTYGEKKHYSLSTSARCPKDTFRLDFQTKVANVSLGGERTRLLFQAAHGVVWFLRLAPLGEMFHFVDSMSCISYSLD